MAERLLSRPSAPVRPNNVLSGMVNVRWTPEQEEEFIRAVEEIGVSRYGPWVVDIHSGRACPCRSQCVFACFNLKSTMATARDMHRASAGAIRLRGMLVDIVVAVMLALGQLDNDGGAVSSVEQNPSAAFKQVEERDAKSRQRELQI